MREAPRGVRARGRDAMMAMMIGCLTDDVTDAIIEAAAARLRSPTVLAGAVGALRTAATALGPPASQ